MDNQATFRLPPEIKEKAEKEAEREHRTLSSWLRKTVAQAVEDRSEEVTADN